MSGSLRESMPKTAALVDEVRAVFGAAALRKGSFYAAEVGQGGELLEYGAPLDGKRRVVVDGRVEVVV